MTHTKTINLLIIVSFLLACSGAMANYASHPNNKNTQHIITPGDSLLMMESQALSKAYRFDAAIELLEQVVKNDSLNRSAVALLEGLYFKTSQHRAAIHLSDFLIAQNIDSAYYEIRKGLSLKKIGQYQKSLDIFLAVFDADSSNSFISSQIGDLYKALENPDSALVFYNKTCQIKANSSVMIKALDLYLKENREKEALHFFKRHYKPKFAGNRILLRLYGKTLYVNGKINSARETFNSLYASGDSSLVTCKFLGTCLWKQEEYGEGIPVLNNFVLSDTTDYQVHYMLGTCYLKYEFGYNPEKGVHHLEKAISLIQPDGKTLNLIYNELALHYQYHKNYDQELEIYRIMKRNDPESRYVDYKMATLYDYGLNDKKEALQRYQDLLALYNADTIDNKKSDIVTFCEDRIKELQEENFW